MRQVLETAWKQAVGLGYSLDMRHIRRQLGIHEVEAVGEEYV